ncbi:MAG TPA: cellulose biosynthesis cyclic di-GMP-binding regulatory protein BcsB, partial [Leclercia adecarboxylata]|nr:cellulose biosynthesis cyclic di-GMP-binding regulatory protein BcsB [Leclercia adecarboxylata]
MFGVLVQPVTAEEQTTVESLLPVDLPPPVTDASQPAADAVPAVDAAPAAADTAPATLPAPDTLPAFQTPPVAETTPAPEATPVPEAAPAAPTGITPGTTSSITVAQMGQPNGVVLRGGQLQGGIDFTLSADQVITNAQLELNLKVSPAMAARNTTLQLMLNGQPLGTVPLGSADSNVSSYQLDVPAAMVVSRNNISFKINDGDALLCQRDLSDSYQVTIMPNTRLDLEAQQLNIAADLSHFPRPFLDEMQMTPTTLTFAFPAKTLPEQVGAAALIASWLGIEADYRGIAFDALHDQLPEKNGILFGKPGESIGGFNLPAPNG